MKISTDDNYLLSASEDGSFYIYKIIDKDGRGLKRDKEIVHAEEILITKRDLQEKVIIAIFYPTYSKCAV